MKDGKRNGVGLTSRKPGTTQVNPARPEERGCLL